MRSIHYYPFYDRNLLSELFVKVDQDLANVAAPHSAQLELYKLLLQLSFLALGTFMGGGTLFSFGRKHLLLDKLA